MKQVDIYVPEERISEITEILHKNGVGGISISTVHGRGKIPHEPIPEIATAWMTGKKIIPEYVTRLKFEAVVTDGKVKPIVDDLSKLDLKRGKVFVHDISEAYDLVKQTSGESALD
jgi:nitrogen regulatory protein P-II 1